MTSELSECGVGRAGRCRARRGRVDERPAAIHHQLDQGAVASDQAALAAQGFRAGRHQQVGNDPGLGAEAAPARSKYAERMGLIHDQRSVMAGAGLSDSREGSLVAVHRIDGFDAHDPAPGGVGAGELTFEIRHIVVSEAQHRAGGELGSVISRRMAHPVEDERVLGIGRQRGQGTEIGLVARGGEQAVLAVDEARIGLLKLAMNGESAEQPGRARPRARPAQGPRCTIAHRQKMGQPKIVVGRPVDEDLAPAGLAKFNRASHRRRANGSGPQPARRHEAVEFGAGFSNQFRAGHGQGFDGRGVPTQGHPRGFFACESPAPRALTVRYESRPRPERWLGMRDGVRRPCR